MDVLAVDVTGERIEVIQNWRTNRDWGHPLEADVKRQKLPPSRRGQKLIRGENGAMIGLIGGNVGGWAHLLTQVGRLRARKRLAKSNLRRGAIYIEGAE